MAGHSQRAHALLSASSAHRWLYCTPSAVLEQQFPDTASEAAQEGTVAHELAEMKLRNYFFTTSYSKRKMNADIKKLKGNGLWQDEMNGYTDEYLDYVKATALGFDSAPYAAIEKRVDFSAYVPDGFGTADCILIHGDVLHVVDFKYGKGVSVSAEGNPQLALYALGAYEAYKILYPVTKIRMSIFQPRISNISEWECSTRELLAWGDFVRKQAAVAARGEGEYHPGEKTCRFCRAAKTCRARAEKNLELAFGPCGKLPPLISDEEVGEYLSKGADVARWLGDLKEYALGACLAGKKIPGWKAVEGRGSREWTDMDKAFEVLGEAGIAEEVLFERRPLTLAQCEAMVGKKAFAEKVGDFVVKKPGKPALVPESDKRPAVTNTVHAADVFQKEV